MLPAAVLMRYFVFLCCHPTTIHDAVTTGSVEPLWASRYYYRGECGGSNGGQTTATGSGGGTDGGRGVGGASASGGGASAAGRTCGGGSTAGSGGGADCGRGGRASAIGPSNTHTTEFQDGGQVEELPYPLGIPANTDGGLWILLSMRNTL